MPALSPVPAAAPVNAAAAASTAARPAPTQGIFFGETAGPGPQRDASGAAAVIQKYGPVFEALGAKSSIQGADAVNLRFPTTVEADLAGAAMKDAIDGVSLSTSADRMVMARIDSSPEGFARFLDRAKLPGVSSVIGNNEKQSIMVMLAGNGGGKMGGVAAGADLTEAVLRDQIGSAKVQFEAL